MEGKSTVKEIRERFDADVERFSKLETGQSATIDAPLSLELVAQAAARVCPHARDLLDIGCGAGNFSLKLLQRLPDLNVTLNDLSRPMLDRAQERISRETRGRVQALQADVRALDLPCDSFDVVVAAAVLHHLREESEWRAVFEKVARWLRPGGTFWIFDLVEHSTPQVQEMMWERYGEYLIGLKGLEYRDHVFAYVAREDTPRPLLFQTDLLRTTGFHNVEILHKNGPFAVFGGSRGERGSRGRPRLNPVQARGK